VERLLRTKPLVFFDLETTGTDPATDRIVEIATLRLDVDGGREGRTRRLNPERPIPPEATAIHGIRDADVAQQPTFARIARGLLEFLGDADLAGFNIVRFDVPLLDREFRDCGLDLDLPRRALVDVMAIFHRKEPRDLGAAVRFYLDREHEGAHQAEADVLAAAEILEAQLERYPDLPRSVTELDAWCDARPRDAVDRFGKFVWKEGHAVFAFGKFRGRSLEDVSRSERDYLEWIAGSDFPSDARQMVQKALRGEYPRHPRDGRS
jgi:DNA polymerase-3 subunit epsilon